MKYEARFDAFGKIFQQSLDDQKQVAVDNGKYTVCCMEPVAQATKMIVQVDIDHAITMDVSVCPACEQLSFVYNRDEAEFLWWDFDRSRFRRHRDKKACAKVEAWKTQKKCANPLCLLYLSGEPEESLLFRCQDLLKLVNRFK